MTADNPLRKPSGLALLLGWRRLRTTLIAALLIGLLLSTTYTVPTWLVLGRVLIIALGCLIAFGTWEQWPRRLPRWIGRWVLQVLGVALAVPFAAVIAYLLLDNGEAIPLWQDKERIGGMAKLIVVGLLLAPWIAMSALLRQRDSTVRNQAQAFELERSELERGALDARLRLLQAQVEPHFLFNTLANVRELVDSGSPQASAVLDSLIDYLRAAVPRLHEAQSTLAQELQLVRSYLELMQMRMPDRLQFAIDADPAAAALACPPMSVLTLVENAVRHGIDPAEDGGRIDIRVGVDGGRCRIEVSDSGVGLATNAGTSGTGLATLRERLQLAFRGDATLELRGNRPHGVRVIVDMPAQEVAA